MFKRLYVQYQPAGPSHALLADLINIAYRKDDGARPMPNEQIHITVIHFGALESVYKDILAINPALQLATFEDAVEQFAASCAQACPASLAVRPKEFARFGRNKQTFVLLCEADDDLYTAHRACLVALKAMFKDCGIADPESFMANHHNFKHALSLSPHITLLKNAQKTQHLEVPDDVLELQLMKIKYEGYTGIE